MPQVTLNNGIRSVPVGTLFSALLTDTPHPCGGKGTCGKCKVCVGGTVSPLTAIEQRHLTPAEIAAGIRLSCQTMVQGDCWVKTADTAVVVVTAGDAAVRSVHSTFARYGAAIDVGTTTLAARLYAPDGTLLAAVGAPNPQTVFGADVLTRVEASINGKAAAVTASIRQGLADLLTRLTAVADCTPSDLDQVVITGNTVMLTLLMGGDATPFATAPFTGHGRFGEPITDLLNCETYLAPCASAFIGGDTATALLATNLPKKALLLDIGTNGEMVLNAGDTLYACSTAAGPAFEGVGISCGMVASDGAVDRVELVNGALHPHVIGGGKASGICGSGLVDVLSCLSMLGDADGPALVAADVTLTTEDIQTLLVSKSAIRSGVDTLLHAAGMLPEEITAVYVAGGFGRYLNIPNAIRIGLLPPIPADRVRVVGNAALDGASQLLLDARLREELNRKVAAIRVVDLAQNAYFAERFMENMALEVPR